MNSGAQAGLLPGFDLSPSSLQLTLQLVVTRAQLGNGLFGQQLLQSPFFDVLRFVLLELRDEGYSPL